MYTAKQNWLPELFNSVFDTAIAPAHHTTAPAVNVIENEKDYVVEVAAPGKTKDDFSISLENEQLVISMEKKSEQTDKSAHYLRREFNISTFKQAYILPDDVEVENISAQMTNGILTIQLPKKQAVIERQQNRSIEIA